MAKSGFESVDAYLQAQPEAVRPVLARVRAAIRAGAPAAREGISYNMPAYKLHGEPLLQFAAWKNHYALYAATGAIAQKFAAELREYRVEKGTIRFPLDKPVPEWLIERIAEFCAQAPSMIG